MMRRLRCLIIIIALFICGAVLNVVVAWIIAVRLPQTSLATVQEIPKWAIPPPSAASEQCTLLNGDDWVRHGAGWSECRSDRYYLDNTSGLWN